MTHPTEVKLPEPGACEDCLTVVAYLLIDQGMRAIDDVEDYERVELVENMSASEFKRFDDAQRLEKLVRLSDAQLLAAEVERLRAERDGLVDMYQRLAESMGYTSGKDGMEFSPEEWGAALKTDAERYRWIKADEGSQFRSIQMNVAGYLYDSAIDAALDASRLAPKEETK